MKNQDSIKLDSSSIMPTGSMIPKKPKLTSLGYDRPMSYFKFIFLKVMTFKFLIPIYNKVFKVLKVLLDFDKDKLHHLNSIEELTRMNNSTNLIDSNEFGYIGDVFIRELKFMHKYALESKALYDRAITDLTKILAKGNIKNVFNFGIGFAYIDKELSLKFPDINFYGIERTSAARIYNESIGIPKNLRIFDGDVISHLKNSRYEDGLFIHVRTAVLLPKTFIHDLYSHLENSGFIEIYAIEQLGLSRRTGEEFEFSLADKKSELFRRHMFIHNYPGIMRKFGFEIKNFEYLKTDHPHFDYRMLVINANKG
jgi:hypothetical protein